MTFCSYLSGVALTLRQYSSDGTEVLPPLDQKLNYDFNFQDIRKIGPRQIRPVHMLVYTFHMLALHELPSPSPKHCNGYNLMFVCILQCIYANYGGCVWEPLVESLP